MQLTGLLAFSSIIAQAEQGGFSLSLIQEKYVQGGGFMHPILVVLILGLAFSIAKGFTLLRANTNSKKFIIKVKEALQNGGTAEAIKVCENTRGPIASVFHAGLLRADEGIEAAEKSIMTYGAIEMGFLERGMIWISLFISVAPMLGFTGTVVGMINAFDDIAAANQMSPAIVAGGISIALLTTLFGLLVAIILQFFYNFFVSRIDKLVGDMEESSIELIDALYELKK